VTFDGESLVTALRATFRRARHGPSRCEIVALSEQFVQDSSAQGNWESVRDEKPADRVRVPQAGRLGAAAFPSRALCTCSLLRAVCCAMESGGPWA
jgi:hypothetical protein